MARRSNIFARGKRSSSKSQKSMVDKITIDKDSSGKRSMFSMVIGMTLISLGILMLVVGVVLFFLYRKAPEVDKALSTPVIESLNEATNSRTLTISGEAEDGERVMIFVNDQVVEDNLRVEDGRFSYEYEIEDEGEYRVQAALVEGFPIRLRSEKSEVMEVLADWTAPSSDVQLVYEREVHARAFSITGVIEPGATVVLLEGEKKYVAQADEEGMFEIRDIPLAQGDNSFDVELRDSAGNVTRLDQDVVVASNGDVNGNGASDLPEASGELSEALSQLAGNKMVGAFGIAALVILVANSTVVFTKLRRELA